MPKKLLTDNKGRKKLSTIWRETHVVCNQLTECQRANRLSLSVLGMKPATLLLMRKAWDNMTFA